MKEENYFLQKELSRTKRKVKRLREVLFEAQDQLRTSIQKENGLIYEIKELSLEKRTAERELEKAHKTLEEMGASNRELQLKLFTAQDACQASEIKSTLQLNSLTKLKKDKQQLKDKLLILQQDQTRDSQFQTQKSTVQKYIASKIHIYSAFTSLAQKSSIIEAPISVVELTQLKGCQKVLQEIEHQVAHKQSNLNSQLQSLSRLKEKGIALTAEEVIMSLLDIYDEF